LYPPADATYCKRSKRTLCFVRHLAFFSLPETCVKRGLGHKKIQDNVSLICVLLDSPSAGACLDIFFCDVSSFLSFRPRYFLLSFTRSRDEAFSFLVGSLPMPKLGSFFPRPLLRCLLLPVSLKAELEPSYAPARTIGDNACASPSLISVVPLLFYCPSLDVMLSKDFAFLKTELPSAFSAG